MNKILAIYGGSALVLTVAWALLILVPSQKKMKALESEIAKSEKHIADFTSTIEQIPEYLETKEDLIAFREGLNSTLYAGSDILRLFSKLEKDARTHRLAVNEITPPVDELLELNRNVGPDEPQFLNITLKMTGNYIDFGRYMTELEKAPYFRGINDCRITAGNEENTKSSIVVGFKALLGQVRGAA